MPSRLFEGLGADDALLRSQQLLSALSAAIWEADRDGSAFTFVSPHAEHILGYPVSAWTSRGFWQEHLHPDDRARVIGARHAAVRERRDHELEYRMVTADGRVAWLRDLARVTVGPAGEVRVHGLIVDVSAQKQTELALRTRTAELDQAQRLARIGNFTHDLASDIVTLSTSCSELFGPDAPEATSFDDFLRHVHPDDGAALRAHLARVLPAADSHFQSEYRYQRPGLDTVHIRAIGQVVRLATGEAQRVVGTMQDVTEQRTAEAARFAHVRFLESLDLVNLAFQGATDFDEMMANVFDAMLTLFDCDRAWLARRTSSEPPRWQLAIERHRPGHPGARPGYVFTTAADRLFRPVTDRAQPFTVEATAPDALPPDVQEQFQIRAHICVAVTPSGHPPFVLGLHHCRRAHEWTASEERLLQEIGRRLSDALGVVLAHQAVRAIGERYRLIVDHATDAIMLHGDDGVILDVNRQACEALGYSREELIGHYMAEFDPVLTTAARRAYRERMRAGEVVELESVHQRKDGSHYPVEIRARGFLQDGAMISVSLTRDISQRRQAEQQALASHALMRAIVEGTSDAISVKDLRGRYLLVNGAFADLHGKTVDELIGARDVDAGTGADGLTADEREVLASGEPRMVEHTIELNGALRTFHSAKFAYWDASEAPIGLIGVSRDTTELKHLEEALRQSQKMEAIGRLAGGVAHNFNNLLTVILGYAEVMGYGMADDDPNREAIDQITKGAERAAAVTRQLLSFSRKQTLTPRVVHLPTALEELRALLRPLISEDIEMTVHADDDLGSVAMDGAQFEQAMTNLVVNASDAMPNGGRLRIEAVDQRITAHSPVHPELVKPGRYVEVRVWDSGHGMDEATRDRIFEPFFTTKPLGKGTGLGLATVYGFVTQTGGRIDVTSTPGGGTLFRLLLPCTDEAVTGVPRPPADASSTRGTETVLLAEDEDAVRAVAKLMLETRGYHVLEARDGVHALEVARAYPGRIDLLLSDLVMPRMNGRDLATTLVAELPHLQVLFMSGYPDKIVPDEAPVDPRFDFLRKPFQPSALARRVRDVLDRRTLVEDS